MQASEKGQERPFLAQNSHFGHFYNVVLGQTWTTLRAHNGQVGLTFVSTDDNRPTFGNTFRKMAKTIKIGYLWSQNDHFRSQNDNFWLF